MFVNKKHHITFQQWLSYTLDNIIQINTNLEEKMSKNVTNIGYTWLNLII